MGPHKTLILSLENIGHIGPFYLFSHWRPPKNFPFMLTLLFTRIFWQKLRGNSQKSSVGGNARCLFRNVHFCRLALLNQRFVKVIHLISCIFPPHDYWWRTTGSDRGQEAEESSWCRTSQSHQSTGRVSLPEKGYANLWWWKTFNKLFYFTFIKLKWL